MQTLNITEIRVLHHCKDKAGYGLNSAQCAEWRQRGFFLDTCLRQLLVPADPYLRDSSGAALLLGENAYRFLLETACGLHSAVAGETNILGQFRCALEALRDTNPAAVSNPLLPILSALLEDSHAIRAAHLQGIGGLSYGSLARKLLNPGRDARVLFVGSGDLAQSMVPLFRSRSTGIWNYREPVRTPPFVNRSFGPDAVSEAAAWATHVILTTPGEVLNDTLWASALTDSQAPVLHLGQRRGALTPLTARSRYSCLDDLFELREQQSDIRLLQLRRAQRACNELTQQRISAAGLSCPLPARALA